jgi:diacylglycerol kinase
MKLVRSFKYALDGLKLVKREYNMKIHLSVALVIVVSGLYFSITKYEWLAVLLSIGLVISAEIMNTAVEEAMNLHTSVHPETYPKAGRPKDIGAAAVLVASILAAVVGLIIFVPYILALFW